MFVCVIVIAHVIVNTFYVLGLCVSLRVGLLAYIFCVCVLIKDNSLKWYVV